MMLTLVRAEQYIFTFFHKLTTTTTLDADEAQIPRCYTIGSQNLLEAGSNHQNSYTKVNTTIVLDLTAFLKSY